jgi:hypothetical protein
MAVIIDGTNGVTTPAVDTQGNLAYTGTLTGGTGVINIGSGQLYKDASGNVGIGTSSPTERISVSSAGATGLRLLSTAAGGADMRVYGSDGSQGLIGTFSNHVMTFYTNSAERARIDSSGNLLVGTTVTSAGSRFVVDQSLTTNVRAAFINHSGGFEGLNITCTKSDYTDIALRLACNRAASSAYTFIQAGAEGTNQFSVRGDGVIFAQNTTVQSISDARVKENVQDSNEGLETVLNLRPVRFDFKEGFGNNRKNQLGFIAQEVESVFPDAVDVAGELDENGEPYKSVGPSAMIPVLIKAIQEQQAMIASQSEIISAQQAALEQLKADVAELKGAQA